MKKIIYGASFLALVGIAIVGCQKEILDTKPESSTIDYEVELKEIGIEHNKALEEIYLKLKTNLPKEKLNKNDLSSILEFTKFQTNSFFQENEYFIKKDINYAISLSNNSFSRYEDLSPNTKIEENDNLWSSEIENSLTLKQKELLSILNEALNNDSLDLNATLKIFKNIRNRSKSECTNNEQIAIIAAIEVGTNSLNYWNEHSDEWIALFGNKNKKWFSWKKVGAGDIQGAIGGAISGGISGGVGGIGLGALGGAIGGSAASAIVQIWKHLF